MLLSSGGLSVWTKWKFPFSVGQVEGVTPEIETLTLRHVFPLQIFFFHLFDSFVFGAVVASCKNGIWIWSRLTDHACMVPTQPNQALTCSIWSWGNETHPNPPQHPDLKRPVSACPADPAAGFLQTLPACPAPRTGSHSALGGLAIWASWHRLHWLGELMLQLKPGTKAVSAN